MSKVGEQLLEAEIGWKRYNDSDSNIAYNGNLISYRSDYHTFYNGLNSTIKFNFTGTKIRILCECNDNGNYSSANIKIDNNISSDVVTNYRGGLAKRPIIIYENTNLKNIEHYITITVTSELYFIFDCIDIDYEGILKPYLKSNNEIRSHYLIEQSNDYYYINHNYIKIGQPSDNDQLTSFMDKYAYKDISILTKTLSNRKVPVDLEDDNINVSWEIDLNDVIDSISLIEEEDKKYVQYTCNDYKIVDEIKKNNDGKFNVVMKEII